MRNPFRYFNSSPEVIRLTVMMYIRYPLSLRRRCQTKAIRYPKIVMHQLSGRKLPPVGQGSGAVLLEDVAAIEVAVLVEVVVD